jgi:nucleoside-diphosphate-sugar epimerase
MNPPRVLLTGATGYIASHTWLALAKAGYQVVGVDNFSNSSPEVLARLQKLGGPRPISSRWMYATRSPSMRSSRDGRSLRWCISQR